MNNTNDETSKPTVIPYQWWVAGTNGCCIYVSCVHTAQRGVIEDASESELDRARNVDIARDPCLTIPGVSYRWNDAARVRVIGECGQRGPAVFMRLTLKEIMKDDMSNLPPETRPHARRAAIEALDGLVQRLDRWEFIHWFEDLKRSRDFLQDYLPF